MAYHILDLSGLPCYHKVQQYFTKNVIERKGKPQAHCLRDVNVMCHGAAFAPETMLTPAQLVKD